MPRRAKHPKAKAAGGYQYLLGLLGLMPKRRLDVLITGALRGWRGGRSRRGRACGAVLVGDEVGGEEQDELRGEVD